MNPAHAMWFDRGVSKCINDNSGLIVAQTQGDIYPMVNFLGMRLSLPFQRISNLPSEIKVSIRGHACHDPVNKLYYSCGYVWACLILWGVSGWFRQKRYTVSTVWRLWWAQDLLTREEMKTKCLFFPNKMLVVLLTLYCLLVLKSD